LYGLDLNQVDVDIIRFEQGVKALFEINTSNEAAAMELEKQYVGVLFEDKSYAWAASEKY
jgi:two-component system LytT family response regulator